MILALILNLMTPAHAEVLIDRCVASILDSEFAMSDKIVGVAADGIRRNERGQLVITYKYENNCVFTKIYAYRQYEKRCDVQNVGPNTLTCDFNLVP